jgi:hypothetical protein
MNKKIRGQGALEYLLLIGGAVLIAVIVIALLVGMGGQSRDTAQDQADKAAQAADVPQPAQIISVIAEYDNCEGSSDGNISFAWRPLGEGGSHELKVTDSANNDVTIENVWTGDIDSDLNYSGLSVDEDDLNPNELNYHVHLNNVGLCGDSYYLYVVTTKNNQEVQSQKNRFSWTK